MTKSKALKFIKSLQSKYPHFLIKVEDIEESYEVDASLDCDVYQGDKKIFEFSISVDSVLVFDLEDSSKGMFYFDKIMPQGLSKIEENLDKLTSKLKEWA